MSCYIFNWPSEVKGDLHWLFCSATVVGAEMLAERELSGPADHWMALANEGKRLRPFNLRDYAALYLYWNRYKVCNSRILTIIIFQQKRWWKCDFQTFISCLITYTMLTWNCFCNFFVRIKYKFWTLKKKIILLYRYYLICRLRNSICYKLNLFPYEILRRKNSLQDKLIVEH